MSAWKSPLCPEVFSWNVVGLLHQQDRIDSDDIIRIELHRMKAGVVLSPLETTIALLLSDESWRVRELIAEEAPIDEQDITAKDREVLLWLELKAVRNQWTELSEPAFYVEEILEQYDLSNLYAEARFFRTVPRREWGMMKYVERFDQLLDLHRRRLCQHGRTTTPLEWSATTNRSPSSKEIEVSIDEIDDPSLDLATARLVEERLVIDGYVDLWHGLLLSGVSVHGGTSRPRFRGWRRYPLRFEADGVRDYSIQDEAGLEELIIESIEQLPGAILVRGVIPATLRVLVRSPASFRLRLSVPERESRIGTALGRRNARITIAQTADSLLREFALPPISESHFILHPDMWELLADIDTLQAGLAGSRTWGRTERGHHWRHRLAAEARRIAREVVRFGVWNAATELQQIADDLERWAHA
ncbi:hypothetical protein [Microbacterium sp. PMB16]|uniref:hypothetical protein n=1 Tax=Microbacterium sp. PMB16 TaxID=3120157 RepID=UPI003F4B4876